MCIYIYIYLYIYIYIYISIYIKVQESLGILDENAHARDRVENQEKVCWKGTFSLEKNVQWKVFKYSFQ